MKIKLYTHLSDIDGLGCAVLAKLAFVDPVIHLCDYTAINEIILDDFFNGEFDKYDKIFITDLSVKYKTAALLNVDDSVHDKLVLLDHHASAIEKEMNNFDFVNVKVKDGDRLTCGTEMFYKYLLENKLLYPTEARNQFVELTRLHDTYEWKNYMYGEKANKLAQFLAATWPSNYIETMTDKLANHYDFVKFTLHEKEIIESYHNALQSQLVESVNNMKTIPFFDTIIGVANIDYAHRNEFAQFCRDNNVPVDVIAIPDFKRGTCSFRDIKPFSTSKEIAEHFGGGGHVGAAACNFTPKLCKTLNISNEDEQIME